MRKVKIKKQTDANIAGMFNQIIGAGDVDIDIVEPKLRSVMQNIKQLSNILDTAVNDVLSKVFDSDCADILAYSQNLKEIKLHDDIGIAYSGLKENNYIRLTITTCRILTEYETGIVNNDYGIINRIPGFKFNPFSFSNLNIKPEWTSLTDLTKKYIFTVLQVMLTITRSIYETITSPDVDVKEFSRTITACIGNLKKQVSRCDDAFAKIEASVGMLENNFSNYHRDFIQSRNPNTILESFLIDVSQNDKTDLKTMQQFRRIIRHYQKLSQGRGATDHKMQNMFDILNSNIDAMSP